MKQKFIFCSFIALFGVSWAQMCTPREFQCESGECIPAGFVCDKYTDCSDASDEKQDCGTCYNYEFQCTNSKCIFSWLMCDGKDDCEDGSDEKDEEGNCPKCPAYLFQCQTTGGCLPRDWVCDGYDNCWDGSDEPETCEWDTVFNIRQNRLVNLKSAKLATLERK